MSALVLPSVLRQQPQQAVPLDQSNPLVVGLVHSWGLNVRGMLALHDATGKAHGVFGAGATGNPSGNSWRPSPQGYYVNFDDGGTGSFQSVNLPVGNSSGSGSPGSSTFSFIARIRISTLPSVTSVLYGSNPGGIEIRITSQGMLDLVKQQTVAMGSSVDAIVPGIDCDVGLSYDGATVRFYVNGAPSGTFSITQTFAMNFQHYLGNADVVNERITNGTRVYRFDMWNRPLSAAEFKAWSDNPWQMYKAPTRRLWLNGITPAGNAYTLPALSGAYALTGKAAGLLVARRVSATPGSYQVVGKAAALAVSRRMSAAVGSYFITGIAANLAKGTAPKALQVEFGNYAIIGRDAILKVARRMVAIPGSYSITGYATGFPQDYSGFRATARYIYIPRSKLKVVRFA